MSSIVDVDAGQVLAALAHAIDALSELDAQSLTRGDRLAVLRGVEALMRRIPAAIHPIVNKLVAEHLPGQFGGANLADVLADTLRITRSDARRRIRDAAELAPTTSLTGETIEPVLAATAVAQQAGTAGYDHIAVIRQFWDRLPRAVDVMTRAAAEKQPAGLAGTLRPDGAPQGRGQAPGLPGSRRQPHWRCRPCPTARVPDGASRCGSHDLRSIRPGSGAPSLP